MHVLERIAFIYTHIYIYVYEYVNSVTEITYNLLTNSSLRFVGHIFIYNEHRANKLTYILSHIIVT